MITLPQLVPPPDGMTRVCAFSVATALAWVGHDCHGGCPAETKTMSASVWFIRTPGVNARSWATTLVVMELSPRGGRAAPVQTPDSVRTMLRRVNDCTRSEHIRVQEWVKSDHPQTVTADSRIGAPLYSPAVSSRSGRARTRPEREPIDPA